MLVVGKSREGRGRAVDWLCSHLVVEPGRELKKQTTTSFDYLLQDSTNETGEGLILAGPKYGHWTTAYLDVTYLKPTRTTVLNSKHPHIMAQLKGGK